MIWLILVGVAVGLGFTFWLVLSCFALTFVWVFIRGFIRGWRRAGRGA